MTNLMRITAGRRLPPAVPSPGCWQRTDILGQNVFERDGNELASPGVFVNLGPRQCHLLAMQ
jgi:hypothetical protein